MKRWLLPLLVLANLALALWVASMWFTPQGHLVGLRWEPPAPLPPALGDAPTLPGTEVDLGRYVATLERPLFSPSRRMPPPPPPASAPAVSDAPPDLQVLGIYGTQAAEGAQSGGMVARIDGRTRRFKIGDSIGGWTLKALRADEVVLALGQAERAYPLRRMAADTLAAAEAGTRDSASAPAVSPSQQAARDKDLREMRDRVRRMNVLRARTGLPPLPEP